MWQILRGGLTAPDPHCSESLNNTNNFTLSAVGTYAEVAVAVRPCPGIVMSGNRYRRGSETSTMTSRFPGCPKELPTLKGIVNDMSRVHRMSYATGGMVRKKGHKAAKSHASD